MLAVLVVTLGVANPGNGGLFVSGIFLSAIGATRDSL